MRESFDKPWVGKYRGRGVHRAPNPFPLWHLLPSVFTQMPIKIARNGDMLADRHVTDVFVK